jgi:ABC-type Zn uptake system ZnuABC Zn-binding protein ZnuA
MEVKLQAYKGLIQSVLEYASTAWDPHQSYIQEKLEKVQKRAARFITSNYNYEPGSMTTILKQTKFKPLKERRKQNS